MAARKWTPEQRARQSIAIREWRPWEQSTGVKTPEGKAVSSCNAYKGGYRELLRNLSKLLHKQQATLDKII